MSELVKTATSKILQVAVSLPKTFLVSGREVSTGIFKEKIDGKVPLKTLNLDGDEQADLTVHGGVDKAVYTYPSEHYPYWRAEYPNKEIDYGIFGENLTTEDLLETDVCIGDEFQVGTAVIRVSQPRIPCYKLGIRFGRPDIIKRFMKSGRSGIYFSVVKEGVLEAGDQIVRIKNDPDNITVSEVANLFNQRTLDPVRIEKILQSGLADQMKMFVSSLVYRG
ncbi:MOSC domain-containing protein [soil metagenome]